MRKKITIFHREIEVKLLLEVLAVKIILMLILAGVYVFEPTITGFVTLNQQEIRIIDSDIVDGNWIVTFDVEGERDIALSVTGNGYAEYYKDNLSTLNYLDILELRCGNYELFIKDELVDTSKVRFVLQNDSKVELFDLVQESMSIKGLYVNDYSCPGFGYYVVKILDPNILGGDVSDKVRIISDFSYSTINLELGDLESNEK